MIPDASRRKKHPRNEKARAMKQHTLLTPRSVTWAGVVSNTILAGAKVATGFFSGSQAIFADGLHSASDLITDVAVLTGLRVAAKPADRDHLYGHRRIMSLVAMFVGAILLAAGCWMGYRAIATLHRPGPAIRANLPFWIALAAVPVKELLYQITRYVGRRESDLSLLANAWHHRTDALTSIVAAAGLGGILLGGPQWAMLDALTSMVLSAFLVVVAVRIIVSSGSELMDIAPSSETLGKIEKTVKQTQGVRSYHAFRARRVGGKVEMDVHIQVEPTLTVIQGHHIASTLKRTIMDADSAVIEVIVHVEPADASDTYPDCKASGHR